MQASMFFSLGLNFALCLEITLTMKNPFYPAERRMKFYLIGAFLSALTIPMLTLEKGLITTERNSGMQYLL